LIDLGIVAERKFLLHQVGVLFAYLNVCIGGVDIPGRFQLRSLSERRSTPQSTRDYGDVSESETWKELAHKLSLFAQLYTAPAQKEKARMKVLTRAA
jgi:hypothetical protein